MTGTAAFVMQQFIVDSARVWLMEKSSLVSGGLIKQIGPDDNRLRRYRVKARSYIFSTPGQTVWHVLRYEPPKSLKDSLLDFARGSWENE